MNGETASTQSAFNQAYIPFLGMESAQEPITKDDLIEALGKLQLAAMDHAKTSPNNLGAVAQVMVKAYDTLATVNVEPPLTTTEVAAFGGSRSSFLMLMEMATPQPAPKSPRTTSSTATTKSK